MTNKILKEGKIFLFKSNDPKNFKDGEQKRDFIYVKDVVKMTCLLIQDAFKDIAGIFNIGSARATTWNELAIALFSALNKEVKIEYIDMPKELENQYQNYTLADTTKFKKFYKEFEITSIQDSVKDYVQNYLLKGNKW